MCDTEAAQETTDSALTVVVDALCLSAEAVLLMREVIRDDRTDSPFTVRPVKWGGAGGGGGCFHDSDNSNSGNSGSDAGLTSPRIHLPVGLCIQL